MKRGLRGHHACSRNSTSGRGARRKRPGRSSGRLSMPAVRVTDASSWTASNGSTPVSSTGPLGQKRPFAGPRKSNKPATGGLKPGDAPFSACSRRCWATSTRHGSFASRRRRLGRT